ncbi:hypothetical protein PIIN_03362 [Serendipita indica DSM 11827]|uniref:Uncharacterized protein n=1 Tax=Serendipita indica (strain DSM 11827) TaxID=1109443 RepID=G4TDQ0_SERID|nr:hypothetical protein PIIN_03362 [Serendipita indica DSM 11827]
MQSPTLAHYSPVPCAQWRLYTSLMLIVIGSPVLATSQRSTIRRKSPRIEAIYHSETRRVIKFTTSCIPTIPHATRLRFCALLNSSNIQGIVPSTFEHRVNFQAIVHDCIDL